MQTVILHWQLTGSKLYTVGAYVYISEADPGILARGPGKGAKP